MELPFIGGATKKKRNQMVAVDLGTRTTKAVLLERRGEVLALVRYAMLDAPIYEKKLSTDALSDHLRSVAGALGGGIKFTTLAVGLDDAIVRQVEFPQIPVEEMRMVLKNNTKGYLQQDLPDHVFDCHFSAQDGGAGQTRRCRQAFSRRAQAQGARGRRETADGG